MASNILSNLPQSSNPHPPTGGETLTPEQCLLAYHDLLYHNDLDAAGLALGDCIMGMQPYERVIVIDTVEYLLTRYSGRGQR